MLSKSLVFSMKKWAFSSEDSRQNPEAGVMGSRCSSALNIAVLFGGSWIRNSSSRETQKCFKCPKKWMRSLKLMNLMPKAVLNFNMQILLAGVSESMEGDNLVPPTATTQVPLK